MAPVHVNFENVEGNLIDHARADCGQLRLNPGAEQGHSLLGQGAFAGLPNQILQLDAQHLRKAQQGIHGRRPLFLFDKTHRLTVEAGPCRNDIE